MLGTRGVPARYGGFETAVEEVGARLAANGHSVTVFSRGSAAAGATYRGMFVREVTAIRKRSLETLSHTIASVPIVVRRPPSVALLFNAANAPVIPALRAARIPVAVHVDGLEWKRAKWEGTGARYFRWAERRSVSWANAVVADSQGIAAYLKTEYAVEPDFIPYGARRVERNLRPAILSTIDSPYHLLVARFEPENHVLEIVRAYVAAQRSWPLVVVGDERYAGAYQSSVLDAGSQSSSVHFLGSVWDQDVLDQIYAHASSYIHGHSVGGTNPSLLRAVAAGAPVVAYDVVFNREVLGADAVYWRDQTQLARLLTRIEEKPDTAVEAAARARDAVLARYDWDQVAKAYEGLCLRLAR